jgi:hypothetical protein
VKGCSGGLAVGRARWRGPQCACSGRAEDSARVADEVEDALAGCAAGGEMGLLGGEGVVGGVRATGDGR